MFKVTTTEGVTARNPENGKGNPKGFPTKEHAQRIADVCNDEAEALSIKTRYEVSANVNH